MRYVVMVEAVLSNGETLKQGDVYTLEREENELVFLRDTKNNALTVIPDKTFSACFSIVFPNFFQK